MTTRTVKKPTSIERPVGEGETNRSSDLEAVRNALADRGLCRRSVAGQWNAKFKGDLTAGIRIFQRKAGLEPDGLVIPGGPTAIALALGGDAASTRAPSENKLADATTCRALQRRIDKVEREVAELTVRVDRLTQHIRKRGAEHRRLLSDLGIRSLGNIIGNINAMAQLRRRPLNLPDPQRPEVQEAIRLTDEIDTAILDLSEVATQRIGRQGEFFRLQAIFAQDCRGSA